MISFIIVNYKSEQELKKCLFDLEKITGAQQCEVIIVNNDKKKLNIPHYNFETQHHCEINKNIGYGAANNHGLNFASRDYVCFLNPDTYEFDTNLLEITNFIDEQTIASPHICTPKNLPQEWSCGEKITLRQTVKNNFKLHKKPWLEEKIHPVYWVSGAALFAQTNLIKKLEGFDEDYFLYFEDVDLCYKLQKNGGSVLRIPYIKIIHSCGKSSRKTRKKQKRCYYNSQDIFFKKHVGMIQMYILRTLRFFYR